MCIVRWTRPSCLMQLCTEPSSPSRAASSYSYCSHSSSGASCLPNTCPQLRSTPMQMSCFVSKQMHAHFFSLLLSRIFLLLITKHYFSPLIISYNTTSLLNPPFPCYTIQICCFSGIILYYPLI